MKKIALIGSTGSIGRQVLNVCRRHADKYRIVSLAAGNNYELLKEQVKEFCPLVATSAIGDKKPEGFSGEYYFGEEAYLNAVTEEADVVVVSLVGFKGLSAVLKSIEIGKDIALANKESLVVGGALVMARAKEKNVHIAPIDSEHSAIWQALSFDYKTPFEKIILTASGGAFRDYDKEKLLSATAKDALKHPNWTMGEKITIDCATLVNKGFEVIEAKWLYGASFDKIDVIIHRESIIHSMVEFADGAVIAQMSYPTMELPIQLALSFPERLNTGLKSLNFAEIGKLSFEKPDVERFPCLKLIVDAGRAGGLYPAVANGANEVLNLAFREGKISFPNIAQGIESALSAFSDNCKDEDMSYERLAFADRFGANHVKAEFGIK